MMLNSPRRTRTSPGVAITIVVSSSGCVVPRCFVWCLRVRKARDVSAECRIIRVVSRAVSGLLVGRQRYEHCPRGHVVARIIASRHKDAIW